LFIEGITRALSLESNRHRQLAVSQRSTRYTAEEDSAIVLEPYYADIYENKDSASPEQEDLLNAFLASCEATIMDYQDQVEILMKLNPLELKGFDLRKWARGKARNILPHALETRITYTGNVRAWRWFIESRSDKHAEPEIRRLADSILTVLRAEAPIYFNDFKVSEVYDGMPVWVPYYHKV
jgi:thymidylate synthase (FAD)